MKLILLVSLILSSMHAEASPFAKIETYSYKAPNSQFEKLFCQYDDHYISLTGQTDLVWVDLFDNNGTWLSRSEYKKPIGVKGVHFHGAKFFQGAIYVFLSGKAKETAKGHFGLYAWKYDFTTKSFKLPRLLAEFPLITNMNRLMVDVSGNGKYIGFVIEPKNFCKVYKHSAAVFNENFELIFIDHCRDQEFEYCEQFAAAKMANDGKLILTYTETFETYEASGFQMPAAQAAFIMYDKSPERHVVYFRDPQRKILSLEALEFENENRFFISWCYADSTAVVGFSLLNIEKAEEKIMYQFNSKTMEPYFDQKSYGTYVDENKQGSSKSTTTVNAFVDLVDFFEVSGNFYFLVQKRNPLRVIIKDGTQNGVSSYDRNSYSDKTTSSYLDLEGDIFLIDVTHQRELKIERRVLNRITPRGILCTYNEQALQLFYYSTPSNALEKTQAIPDADATENSEQHLFRSTFLFESLELITEEISTTSDGKLRYASMLRAITLTDKLMTPAWNGKNFTVIDLNKVTAK